MREFHVWFCKCNAPHYNLISSVLWCLKRGLSAHTDNLVFADTKIITKYGYRLFIHPQIGEPFEITLGKCSNTNREIKPETNILHLLLSGEFDTEDCKVVEEVF